MATTDRKENNENERRGRVLLFRVVRVVKRGRAAWASGWLALRSGDLAGLHHLFKPV